MTLLDMLKAQSIDSLVQWSIIIAVSIQGIIAYKSYVDKTVKHAHWCQSVGMMGTFFYRVWHAIPGHRKII